jgi:hypothetical protein
MSKLTKQQAALHAQACAYLKKDVLTLDERMFVLDHWQESANHINALPARSSRLRRYPATSQSR